LLRSVRQFQRRFRLRRSNQSETLWLCLLTEEVGELTSAVLKGRAKAAVEDEVGDILYVLHGFCELFGYNLRQGVERTISKNDQKQPGRFGKSRSGKIAGRGASSPLPAAPGPTRRKG